MQSLSFTGKAVNETSFVFIMLLTSVGKKGLLNGEVNTSSPETSRSASQNSDSEKKIPDAEGTAPDHNNLKAKPFDINDFFLSDTLLPLTGGVSF